MGFFEPQFYGMKKDQLKIWLFTEADSIRTGPEIRVQRQRASRGPLMAALFWISCWCQSKSIQNPGKGYPLVHYHNNYMENHDLSG